MSEAVRPYDLVIVGASFAGLVAARTAAMRGLKVAVLEAKPEAGHRVATTGILVKEAAEELKGLIRATYPDAELKLVRAADQQRSWHLWAMVDADDLDDVGALVVEREGEMLAEEHIPIHVIPIEPRKPSAMTRTAAVRKTG